MKRIVLFTVIGLLTASVSYSALTSEQEDFVGQLFNNKGKLIDLYQRSSTLADIADNVGLETIPLQIKVKRDAIQALLTTKDANIKTIKQDAQVLIVAEEGTAQTAIDVINGEISALEALLP